MDRRKMTFKLCIQMAILLLFIGIYIRYCR